MQVAKKEVTLKLVKNFDMVSQVFIAILSDEKFSERLFKMRDPQEIYVLFREVSPDGYTEEEFDNFIFNLLTLYDMEVAGKEGNILEILGMSGAKNGLSDDALRSAVGGVGGMREKVLSGALAFMAVFSSASASAAGSIGTAKPVKPSAISRGVDYGEHLYEDGYELTQQDEDDIKHDFERIQKKETEGLEVRGDGSDESAEDEEIVFTPIVTKEEVEKEQKPKSFWERHGSKIKTAAKIGAGIAVTAAGIWAARKLYRTCTTAGKLQVKREALQAKVNDELLKDGNVEAARRALVEFDSTQTGSGGASKAFLGSLGAAMLGGGVFEIIKAPFKLLDFTTETLGDFSKRINQLSNLPYSLDSIQRLGSKFAEKTQKMVYSQSVFEKLRLMPEAFAGVSDQVTAKTAIAAHLTSIFFSQDQAKQTGKKCTPNIMVFAGVSGCGKTFMAKKLAETFPVTSNKFYFVSSTMVDKTKKTSAAQQLFAGTTRKVEKMGDVNESTSLMNYFRNNKEGGWVIIDEWDKVGDTSLDEVMRGVKDTGNIRLGGDEVDVSNFNFILTTNERFEKKKKSKAAEEAEAAAMAETKRSERLDSMRSLGGSYETSVAFDPTGSRTPTQSHDRAFMNRIKLIEFDNLKAEDYKPILRNHIGNDIQNYFLNISETNLSFSLSVNALNAFSQWVERKNQGARPIDLDVIPTINSKIVEIIERYGYKGITGSKWAIKFKTSKTTVKDPKTGKIVRILPPLEKAKLNNFGEPWNEALDGPVPFDFEGESDELEDRIYLEPIQEPQGNAKTATSSAKKETKPETSSTVGKKN